MVTISDEVKAKWDRERKVYNNVKNKVMGHAICTGLDCGAFGHTSIPVIATVGRDFLIKNTKYTYEDYIDYIFSTYGRHDEELWIAWIAGASKDSEKNLFDAIERGIKSLNNKKED